MMSALPSTIFGQLRVLAEMQAKRAPNSFAMPAHTIKEMELHGVSGELIEKLFGTRDNILRLITNNENLDPDETDKAVRVLRIVDLAEKVFKNQSKALMWLSRSNRQLGAKPFDLLVRESGAKLVEEALLRMEYGVFA